MCFGVALESVNGTEGGGRGAVFLHGVRFDIELLLLVVVVIVVIVMLIGVRGGDWGIIVWRVVSMTVWLVWMACWRWSCKRCG